MVAKYYDDGHGLHLAFNFPPLLHAAGRPRAGAGGSTRSTASSSPPGWPTWVLSNHDSRPPPHPLRLRGPGPGRRRAAARPAGHAVPLRRRGAGPRGRRWCRPTGSSTPAAATAAGRRSRGTPAADHGWGTHRPVAAVAARAPSAQRRGACGPTPPRSLHLYRRLLAARRSSAALRVGDQALLDAPDGVLGWEPLARRRPPSGAGELHRRRGGTRRLDGALAGRGGQRRRRARASRFAGRLATGPGGAPATGPEPLERRGRRALEAQRDRLAASAARGRGRRGRRRPARPRRRRAAGWARRRGRPASPARRRPSAIAGEQRLDVGPGGEQRRLDLAGRERAGSPTPTPA